MSQSRFEPSVAKDPITVAVVEDDATVRASLKEILSGAKDLDCVATCSSAEEAVRCLPKLRPRVVLLDISLPGMDGVECAARLSELLPETLLLMLTVYDNTETIFNSLAAGASGYLLKPVRAADLLAAVRDVYGGGAPMTSNIARKVVQTFKKRLPPGEYLSAEANLSTREQEVLNCLCEGYAYKEIAKKLDISYSTVHTHIRRIYEKLHVCSRAEAVAAVSRFFL